MATFICTDQAISAAPGRDGLLLSRVGDVFSIVAITLRSPRPRPHPQGAIAFACDLIAT